MGFSHESVLKRFHPDAMELYNRSSILRQAPSWDKCVCHPRKTQQKIHQGMFVRKSDHFEKLPDFRVEKDATLILSPFWLPRFSWSQFLLVAACREREPYRGSGHRGVASSKILKNEKSAQRGGFWGGHPRTFRGHSRGYPGPKLLSGRSKSWKNKHVSADIHDPKGARPRP